MCEDYNINLDDLEYYASLMINITEIELDAASICDGMIKDKVNEAKNSNDEKLLNEYEDNGLMDLYNDDYLSYDDEMDAERAEIVLNENPEFFYQSDIKDINERLYNAREALENYEEFVNGVEGVADEIGYLRDEEDLEILSIIPINDCPKFWIKVYDCYFKKSYRVCISDIKITNYNVFDAGDISIEYPTSVDQYQRKVIK